MSIGDAVAVDKSDELRAHMRGCRVTCRSGAAASLAAHKHRAVHPAHGRDGVGLRRTVVHDHHAHIPADRPQASVELRCAITHRDHDCDGCRQSLALRSGMNRTRIQEPSSEPAGLHIARFARQQVADYPPPRVAEPENPGRVSDNKYPTVVVLADGMVPREWGIARESGHNARPPSTGIDAPVMPLLFAPASHTSIAATSCGSRSRSTGCWAANASADRRP